MTHKDVGNYSAKHLPDKKLDRKVAEVVKQRVINGRISCASGHKIAEKLNIQPAEVGVTIDLLEIRINKCLLGLFGYSPENRVVKPAEKVSPELEKAIMESLVNSRLSCLDAWEIAGRFKIPRMEVSSACEALKIKISACQLGAF